MYGLQGDTRLGCSEPAPYAQQPLRPTWLAGLVELTEFVLHKLLLGYTVNKHSIQSKLRLVELKYGLRDQSHLSA